ncbi:hypothetical protein HNQ59_000629 [Chitinivorax tropicus]|uniref:Uncharacterized protein n=1 Tax=Chitinivorax tropicus TaxID=714531 RepID=A0A840MIM4_9PROT|nr:hypothetical protein [Chitinivorax tropicus]
MAMQKQATHLHRDGYAIREDTEQCPTPNHGCIATCKQLLRHYMRVFGSYFKTACKYIQSD